MARELSRTASLTMAVEFAALVRQHRREAALAKARADTAAGSSTEQPRVSLARAELRTRGPIAPAGQRRLRRQAAGGYLARVGAKASSEGAR